MRIHKTFAFAIVAVMLSSAAAVADESGQTACMQDALSICGQFIPSRERVAACLMSHRSTVSAGCRSALSHWKTASAN